MQAHVLLADDSLDIRLVVGHALERAGSRVSHAINGDQALDMLIELTPDVAVLDVIMPGLDGLAVCRAARSHPSLEALRVVVMSGDLVEEEAVAAGADHFVPKPFLASQLIAAIERLFRKPPSRLSDPLASDAG